MRASQPEIFSETETTADEPFAGALDGREGLVP